MAHLLVGDGHFVGRPGEALGFCRLLERAQERGVRELSILGDLFELWIGLAGLEQPYHEAVFAPLRQLKQEGVRLRYVVGNKDYFVSDWNVRHRLFDEVFDPGGTVSSPQGPLHLFHGDLANDADRQYRAWRRVSRSWPLATAMRLLPRRALARLGERVALRLQATNRYHKSYFPEAALRARARELPAGAGLLVFGHFHVHKELVEGDKRVVTLPFLGAENAGIWVSAAGIERLEA